MALLTAGKSVVVAASSSETREFQFSEDGVITTLYWYPTSTTFTFVLSAGNEAFDGVAFDARTVGTTFGNRLVLPEPIPVGPGAPIKIKFTDGSGSENTIKFLLAGATAD